HLSNFFANHGRSWRCQRDHKLPDKPEHARNKSQNKYWGCDDDGPDHNENNNDLISSGTFAFFCDLAIAQIPNCFYGKNSRTTGGWTAGGGIEVSPWNNAITLKAEYLYVNLGDNDAVRSVSTVGLFGPGPAPSSFNSTFDNAFHVVRAGVN